MAKLIYSAITSLDGYVADATGNFEWAAPDEEVMTYWETALDDADSPVERDFAQLWLAADKIVFSTTLPNVATARTRLERNFDPAAIRQLKADAERDLGVGGPTLAAHAIRAGLVDEFQLFLNPVVVGGGTASLPDDVRVDLELVDQRRFGNGVVYLQYRARS